ncbi:MAG: hypothetical protein EOP92_24030, partial [Lysobacteraceae bacterium]
PRRIERTQHRAGQLPSRATDLRRRMLRLRLQLMAQHTPAQIRRAAGQLAGAVLRALDAPRPLIRPSGTE